jgi:hypothetical protein
VKDSGVEETTVVNNSDKSLNLGALQWEVATKLLLAEFYKGDLGEAFVNECLYFRCSSESGENSYEHS